MEDNKKIELHITLTQANYSNSLFDRPMFAIDVNKKRFDLLMMFVYDRF